MYNVEVSIYPDKAKLSMRRGQKVEDLSIR